VSMCLHNLEALDAKKRLYNLEALDAIIQRLYNLVAKIILQYVTCDSRWQRN
jgi:hypothetical protein